jgi:peptidoglycan/xylan/chitin deacetylase (PgdA/CDA1 family)
VRRQALFLAAVVLAAVTAGLLLVGSRWNEAAAPNPGGDLDVPVLFGTEEVDYDWLAADQRRGVPIFCYHYFGPGLTPGRLARVVGAVVLNLPTLPDREYWTTPEAEFERHLNWLAENGWRTAFLDDVVDALERGHVPARTVVLTIDDGDRSFVEYAVPVLRRHGFVATLFLLTGRVGEEDWNDLDFVDWDTLRALEAEGILRVESHTHRMHTKIRTEEGLTPRYLVEVEQDPELVRRDLVASREAIRRELGREAGFLAWPFGYSRADVDSLARAVGYRRVLTLRAGRNDGEVGGESGALRRYTITARTSLRLFRLMVDPHAEGAAGT